MFDLINQIWKLKKIITAFQENMVNFIKVKKKKR